MSLEQSERALTDRDTGGVDQEEPDEVNEAAPVVEEGAPSPAVDLEPPSGETVPASEPEPSITLKPEVGSGLVRRADQVSLEDAQVVEVAAESPAVVPEHASVEIVPLSELDPGSTALEPELASELARRADEVILDAAAGESPAAQPANAGSELSGEALRSSDPAAAPGADPPESETRDPPGVFMRTFPAVASSVADARGLVVRALADIPADVLEDIRLMVSELASNAIEHAMSSFELTIYRRRQEIRVEVTDYGGGTPAMRSPGPGVVKGRGLQIVNMVSTQWGVQQESESAKTVWFTLEFAPADGPTPPA